ncbi:MAG TPA: PfkB family carbohydrate kinase [Thermomicrobiaceae bacterium]|nr:PfkB family carbohydrate kinase [Thermomicrobiaceae bacterium]
MTFQHPPDFLAIGHITVDLLEDGTPMLGGAALYSGLAASRFGLRAAILTRGNFSKHGEAIERSLADFAGEVDIIVQDAGMPTVFENRTIAARRQQTIHSWAGPIDLSGLPPAWRSSGIIQLAPVAQEIEPRQAGQLSPAYLCATPQGWMRHWQGQRQRGVVQLRSPRSAMSLASRIDGLALNAEEHVLARDLSDSVARRGIVAITRGSNGVRVIDRGQPFDLPAFPIHGVNELGAGDVFASVLFLLRARREPTLRSARIASAAAALKVSGGGPESIPTREQVEEFLESAATIGRH